LFDKASPSKASTLRFAIVWFLGYLVLAFLDTVTTLAGFERGGVTELNPTLSANLSGNSFRSLFIRDIALGVLILAPILWSWDKRLRFANVDGELTFRKYMDNCERLRNLPVFVALMLPLAAIALKLLAVVNNAMILVGTGSPYATLIRFAVDTLPFSARELQLVFQGLLAIPICFCLMYLFYREAKNQA
jgi:hypothetical protein